MLASRCGMHTVAEVLIKNGADVNIVNKRGETALSLACVNDNFRIINVLLNGGAEIDKVNKDGETPLAIACKGNIVSFIMSSIFQSFRASSNVESTDTRLEIIKLLLSRNADVNKPTHDGSTPLMVACKWQKADVVVMLLDKGACIQSKNNLGENALSIACKNGRLKTVEVLLKHASNPNSLNDNECPLSETVTNDSITQDVSRDDFEKIAQCLIDNGAEIDIADIDSWTPLMSACRGGLKNIAEMLIDHGADVNAAANDGLTVLMLACMSGNKNVVDLVIDRNTINEREGRGWSALKYACKLGHTTIVNTLLKHNADVNQHDIEGGLHLCQHVNRVTNK
ncbi:unnamed protein product [Mytilus edulis]|uniref:ANK_REP_REGION domain-containing protein n=1 Tax=Mytilus edulis TaxID=6550 RepID=A0A8S3VHX0_MYTED|nr:unnamed protein product [Mytilus edulis]